jgi:hypothetical protein
MLQYQSYEPISGRIRRTLNIEPHTAKYYEADGETLFQGEGSGFTDYIDLTRSPPAITPRPVMQIAQDKTTIAAGGGDTMTLHGLPVPCRVRIGSAVYEVPDGVLEWATPMPATYHIKVEAFPHLDWEGEVIAVAGNVNPE